ncbi:helix-turn-helix domain-containing protein [Rhizorhabdus dicambivorans]|uniref:helix-turn-helix domain-containing protein n=1 Tax=Rhizorhabdus dicambivorans TaxID=1850238 RepID=UPI00082A8A22|nr:AraC family transcriptional regulator [Rhizorhabdus dicambivorans]
MRVLAEHRSDDATVSLVDYEWPQTFIFQDHYNSVHYRLMPVNLGLRGTVGGQAERDLGNMSLLPAGSLLKVSDHGADHRARALRCLFAPAWIERLLGQPLGELIPDSDRYLGLRNGNARNCLHRIALELLEPGFASGALIESLMQSAVLEILRDVQDQYLPARATEAVASAKFSHSQMHRIVTMIEDSRQGPPSVAALAAELGFSISHFRRLFRATTGQSVHEFVSALTVEQAKSLLANSRLSMKEITYRLGFTSPSSFSVAFRRTVGCSPSQFRSRARS